MVLQRLRRLARTRRTDDGAEYECTQCNTVFPVRRHVCPECGGYRVERIDWSERET